MPPPPAKRQKRLVVADSDDEAVSAPEPRNSKVQVANTPASRTRSTRSSKDVSNGRITLSRTGTKEKKASSQSRSDATQWSPPSSPERAPARPNGTHRVQSNGSIHKFLNRTTQVAKGHKEPVRKTSIPPAEEVEEQEDGIEDDSPDEKTHKLLTAPKPTRLVLDRRKPLQEQTQNRTVTASQEKPITTSQKFLAVGNHAPKEASTQTKPVTKKWDTRPWAERYSPASLEELMVHKRKVADVRSWLEGIYSGRERKRLLILRGPAGAGKTATISALAKAMIMDVSEWRNPIDSDFSSEAYISMSAQLEDFLGRSGRFGSLDFSADAVDPPVTHSKALDHNKRRKAILMEEFPNTFTSTSQALKSFRSNVLQYLAANTPAISLQFKQSLSAEDSIRPLIMIITETSTDASTSSAESFTAHRLLGPDILHHPGTNVIEFNPIAPTLLTKALELVIQKEARDSGRRRIPGPSVLKKLGEIGDVRSAIGSLEFLCLRGSDGDDWGGRVASKSKKTSNTALTKMEKDSLELLSQREASLGLFHAVGKVVYNKRQEPYSANRPAQPPDHLPQHARLKVSEVSVDTLMEETGTDPRTFLAALHENYVMSCESNHFTDNLNGCLDALSDSDILASERAGRFGSAKGTYQGTATDAIRQGEIAFQIAVRGLLFALPYPVKRISHPVKGGARNDTHKMFYPTSMRLGRQMEEIECLVERWSDQSRLVVPSDSDPDLVTARTYSTQAELVLERLPYVAKMQRSKIPSDLERITQFNGLNVTMNEEAFEDDDLARGAKEDKALMPPPPKPSTGVKDGRGNATKLVQDVGKLYLSDDDIEDE